MTVSELIKQLKTLDGAMKVYVPDYDDPYKTKEAQTVGTVTVSDRSIEPIVIIDFE